ncbi:MAG TPA: aldo/keto reductase [Elusimicrobiota bacterium]|nr:aldo/keto reductase [Elusimicrobiota bacterium]
MRFRPFGRCDFDVSEIGYGAWGIGGTWWGNTVDNKLSLKSLHRAMDEGVNFIDTALVYGNGLSEQLVGRAIREHGQRIQVASKIPPKNHEWPAGENTPAANAFPKEWIVSCTEKSLVHLRLDTIDVMQFHVWHDRWLDQQDVWLEAVRQLKKQGKIRYWGVSINDHSPETALALVKSGLADSVQVIYNLFDQSPAKELLPLCLETKTAVIVRVPFDEGSLTGTLTPDTVFPEGDFRRDYFSGDRLTEACDRYKKLSPLLKDVANSPARAALKFCLSNPAVCTVIPGMRRPEHVADNVGASDGQPYPPELLQELKSHAWKRNFYD